jgi:peptidoglycan-associated lipoprotein
MNLLLKRSSLLILLLLALVSLGCKKNMPVVQPPVPAPPPTPPPPAPTVTLSANTTTVQRGGGITLTYSATNATSVTIDQGVGAVTPVAGGTRTVNPTANTTYTATATGPGGTAQSARVAITVNVPPPPPPPVVNTPPPAPPPVNRGPVRTAAQIFNDTMVPILFDYDKATIRPDQESRLLSMATYLKSTPTVRFTIEGHADERGGQEYNIALGDDRAAAVKKYLSGQGVADARMNTVSYGEEKPICREETEDCWQRNRRAAFVMVP